ncbi:rod shape-determining protein RodA [Thermaurantiacus sp.]
MIGLLNARWPQRLLDQNWPIVALVVGIGLFGSLTLYSAAGGSLSPWALNHALRLGVFTCLMLLLSQVSPQAWLAWAFPIYGLILVALVAVELVGGLGGGSQRWLELGVIRLQPSELMKLALVLVLGRVYHYLPLSHVNRSSGLWLPGLLILLPVGLVLLQPDLGTSLTLVGGGAALVFLAGTSIWYFIIPAGLLVASLPILYNMLHAYQQRRVEIFLNPELDPLGAGYHITQSKIAIGSGGLTGRGFLEGSQSHLLYLPEPHTDFVFATMAEEWGLVGGILLILAYGLLLAWGWRVALRAGDLFQRLVAGGLTMTIFFYVAINLMMVMGLAPVVGLPLPLMSYGGSAMLTVMLAVGILLSIDRVNRAAPHRGVGTLGLG